MIKYNKGAHALLVKSGSVVDQVKVTQPKTLGSVALSFLYGAVTPGDLLIVASRGSLTWRVFRIINVWQDRFDPLAKFHDKDAAIGYAALTWRV